VTFGSYDCRMLIGRGRECERLEQLLDEARGGRSGTLVLRGEAGIGKSALCAYVVEQAAGMAVLRATCAEIELELAFAGLADLFRPVQDKLGDIPKRQAEALSAALGIGGPVSSERFTVCAATLSLLAAISEEQPVLVVVDEAQWLDASSAEALLFAARRLDEDAVVMVFAIRDGRATPFDRSDCPALRITTLDRDSAETMLVEHAQAEIAPAVLERLLQAAAGNALALIELPASLSRGQLDGTEPLGPALPATEAVERAFLRQVDSLPAKAREALLVAAASDSGELEAIERALGQLGLEPRDLESAEQAGLVAASGGRLEFRHPLLRATVYRAGSTVARRAAHQALAQADVVEGGIERRALHLAAAAPGEDETAAEALEEAALAARRRGGYAEAASALERAAGLGRKGPERARRLLGAASAAWIVGRPDHAHELLDAALEDADDPALHARIQHRRAAIDMWQAAPEAARASLVEEANAVEQLDPARAAKMLTDAAWASFMAAEIETGRELAERACRLSTAAGGIAETLAKAVLGIALVLAGETRRAVPLFTGYLELLESMEPSRGVYQPFRPDGQVLLWLEEYDRARETLTRTIDSARAESALGVLPYSLAVLSDLEMRTGRWAAAYAAATEAVRLANETREATVLAFSLACLARVEAGQGRSDDCTAHVEQALSIAYPRVGSVLLFCNSALGLLELGRGQPDEAIDRLEPLAARMAAHGLGEPGVIPWLPDLVEAYVRVGREDEAAELLDDFESLARRTSRRWAQAAAHRCRGLLAPADAFEDEFRLALELHAATPTPFERARTELCLGERRRRARRRAEAREPLRSALETFDRLGAVPWSERARAELAASGETARAHDPYAAEQLTPQELQVALVVARGATNKEAGAALFLSPKTIETHLGRVYRKLNVRSRTELAHLLGTEGVLTGAAA